MTFHNTAAPAAAAGVSCVLGFDLHTALGYAGQIVGLMSGLVSIAWVGYQLYQSIKRNRGK
jgi:hypothetical protein